MDTACIIFDLDGTLVDSEGLSCGAYLELVPELNDTVEAMVARYRGVRFGAIVEDIERRIGRALPADFETRYRARVAALFDAQLAPMPGAAEALAALDIPVCIASNGPLAKMRHALAVTGLEHFFAGRLFSAWEVGIWKPDPGLFLHAARDMGIAPAACAVVEDSRLGIGAALEAGMRAYHYVPDGAEPLHPGALPLTALAALPGLVAHDNQNGEETR